jgi:hypothetical protein
MMHERYEKCIHKLAGKPEGKRPFDRPRHFLFILAAG